MKIRRTLFGATLLLTATALAATLLLPYTAAAVRTVKKSKKHLLVVTVTKGFRHGDSIAVAEPIIEALGSKTGAWDTDFVRTDEEMQAKMTPVALAKYDAVAFVNTTGVLPLPDPQGFLNYIKAGHGFVAMHSGSDTFHEWPGGKPGEVSAYIDMLGGEFLTHHAQTAVEAHIEDAGHPATKPLIKAGKGRHATLAGDAIKSASVVSGKTWHVFDEIYLLKNNDRAKVHVLLSMDRYPNDGSPEANQPGDHLLSWCKAYGKGRVFYTELGHRVEVWKDPLYQAHVQGGIEFALGLAKGSTTLTDSIRR
jgi:type 1 glutamine amidotransferase